MINRKLTYKLLLLSISILLLAGCFKKQTIQADYTAYSTIETPIVSGLEIPPENPAWRTRWTSPQDGMMLVYVPAGVFLMGPQEINPNDPESDQPQYRVYLDAYWIDQTEVTNMQYARCVMAGACQKPTHITPKPIVRNYLSDPEYANYPVIGVSWYGADAYCRWAGRRLPSEAEWEKAARGTDGRRYPWGNEDPNGSRVNFCDTNCAIKPLLDSEDDGYAFTAPVGSYPAGVSPFGVLDMAGNVEEWTRDWEPENYTVVPEFANPHQPLTGKYKISQGGSWMSLSLELQSSINLAFRPRYASEVIGLRCVLDAD